MIENRAVFGAAVLEGRLALQCNQEIAQRLGVWLCCLGMGEA